MSQSLAEHPHIMARPADELRHFLFTAGMRYCERVRKEFADMTKPIAFARSGESCLLGKRTAEIRTRVPDETEEILTVKARGVGMALSEYVCWKLMIDAHGIGHVSKLQNERLARIAGNGSEKG